MDAITSDNVLMTSVLTARSKRIAATPGTEELVNPLEENRRPAKDAVSISERAAELEKIHQMRKNAPRIDWENRTLGDKKISDNIHQELTPEMLSGEQPYSIGRMLLSGEIYYLEQDLPEQERIIQHDLEKLSGMQFHTENMESMQREYDLTTNSPDPAATSVMERNTEHVRHLSQSMLEGTLLSYYKHGIDVLEADRLMSEMSMGQFSLAGMIERYFGINIHQTGEV